MSGIQDFVGMATQKLGLSKDDAERGTGGLLSLIKHRVGEGDFGKIAASIPGIDDLAKAKHGFLGEIASKAGGLFGKGGGAAGALASLASAGLKGDKAASFLTMFVDFVKSKVSPDLMKTILAKVPGLSGVPARTSS